MRVPRDLSGRELGKRLGKVGYAFTRQVGSHMRYTCFEPTKHDVTIPDHRQLRAGTLSSILGDVAAHLRLTREQLMAKLFD